MNKRRLVYTAGSFDLFHSGHVNFLRQCRTIAGEDGRVTVGVNSDEFIEKYRGAPPLLSFADRSAVVRAIKYVDLVRVHENTKCEQREYIAAALELDALGGVERFLVIGSDWAKKDYYKQIGITQTWLDLLDITLVYVPYTDEISSTLLKQRIWQRTQS